MAHAGHGFTHTDVEAHDDGSFTAEHHHEKGPAHNKRYAVSSLDELHDNFEDHLRPSEAEDEARKRGVDPEKLEEAIEPGVHAKALDAVGKHEEAEKMVSPGLHEKLAHVLGDKKA